MRKRKIIMVPPGAVEKICRSLRCSKSTVYDSLAYKSDSSLAVLIRQQAVDTYGGVETTKLVMT